MRPTHLRTSAAAIAASLAFGCCAVGAGSAMAADGDTTAVATTSDGSQVKATYTWKNTAPRPAVTAKATTPTRTVRTAPRPAAQQPIVLAPTVVKRATRPVARTTAKPVARPVAKPVVRTTARPAVRPAVRPAPRPASRPVAAPKSARRVAVGRTQQLPRQAAPQAVIARAKQPKPVKQAPKRRPKPMAVARATFANGFQPVALPLPHANRPAASLAEAAPRMHEALVNRRVIPAAAAGSPRSGFGAAEVSTAATMARTVSTKAAAVVLPRRAEVPAESQTAGVGTALMGAFAVAFGLVAQGRRQSRVEPRRAL